MDATRVTDAVAGVVGTWPPLVVLALAGVVLLVEPATVAGVLLPGTTTLLALGWWSAGAGVPVAVVVGVASAATTSGALLGWRAGARRRLRDTHSGDGRVGVPAAVLATGHWASAGRSVLPRLAGRSGTPVAVAAPLLVASGAAWATTGVLLGRRLGPGAASRLTVVPLVVLVLVVVVAVVVVRSRARSRCGGRQRPVGRSTTSVGCESAGASTAATIAAATVSARRNLAPS